jgi:hypothetical protein
MLKNARQGTVRPEPVEGPWFDKLTTNGCFSSLLATGATMRRRLAAHLGYLGALALSAVLAGLPLLQFKLMRGHDVLVHLRRTVEFYEGLRSGEVFPRWAADFYLGYGAPVFSFYPPLFYYLAAALHGLGLGLIAAFDLAYFALLLVAGFGMYLLAQEHLGPRGGLVAAVALLFAPYFQTNLYARSAAADFSAFAFIPLALWGLYGFTTAGRHRFFMLGAPALALLLLSSSSVALMTFPALLLLVGLVAGLRRSFSPLRRGSWQLLLGLGLAAFFWLPALAEQRFVHLDRLDSNDFRDQFLSAHQLLAPAWDIGGFRARSADGMSFAIGPIQLVAAAAALLLLGRVRRVSGHAALLAAYFFLVLALAAFLACGPSLFVWERVPLLHYLQFPWRFLSLVVVSTAFLCGLPLVLVQGRGRMADGLTGILVLLFVVAGFSNARPLGVREETDLDTTPQAVATNKLKDTPYEEFQPIWVRDKPRTPAAEPIAVVAGAGRVLDASLSPGRREFSIEVAEDARLMVSTYYFPGWTVYVDGVERPVDFGNVAGLIGFSLEAGLHRVLVAFTDTPVRLWSARLSLLALCLLLATPWLARLARRWT